MDEAVNILQSEAQLLGLRLEERELGLFDNYYQLLALWNEKMNLVRFRDRLEVYRVHFLDSLWCTVALELKAGSRVIDIGSGAGLPGIPLKICYPESVFYLLEAQQKRCRFLSEVRDSLELKACCILNGRAEDQGHDQEMRASYDYAVMRAVARMSTLVELALPFLKEGGSLVAMKGIEAEREVKEAQFAIRTLGGEIERIIPYRFTNEVGRHVIAIKKIRETPALYPRRNGIPAKRPLVK
jgi:16S rRNA (guanine527-N7)-methyltransferase